MTTPLRCASCGSDKVHPDAATVLDERYTTGSCTACRMKRQLVRAASVSEATAPGREAREARRRAQLRRQMVDGVIADHPAAECPAGRSCRWQPEAHPTAKELREIGR